MGKFKDLSGNKFERLTVVGYMGGGKWLCRCDCGNETFVRTGHLNAGNIKSCGCFQKDNSKKPRKYKNLVGKRFGRLVVKKYVVKRYWLCRCDCGNNKNIRVDNLEKGTTKSCGCLLKELARERATDNYKDIIGNKFERLTVIKWVGSGKWLCKCSCGNDKIVSTCSLKSKAVKSCGCLNDEIRRKSKPRSYVDDLTGKKFGRLIVKKYKGKGSWNCKCSCGNKTTVGTGNLNSGGTRSCGCLYVESRGTTSVIKHGMTKTKFYRFWMRLKARCNNPKHKSYKNYGGRGIGYTDKWENFEGFYEDMYLSYLKAIKNKMKTPSLERKDVNGNYCKENCIFIPMSEQNKNKRNVCSFIAISPEGKKTTERNANDFAKKHSLNSCNIHQCLKGNAKQHKGWKFINRFVLKIKQQ